MRGRSLALAVFLAGLAGCSRTPAPGGQGLLTLAVRADVTGFFPNPPIVSEAYTIDINRSIFECLVQPDRQFRLQPALAASWENPDDRTYVFELKPGLRFSDGRPLRAADVAASLSAATRRRWVTRDTLQAIESVGALDDRRVEVRTRFPYLVLLTRLSWGFVLPADNVDRTPVPTVGSGPYRLERWVPGREFVLARNPNYHGAAPAYARARFVVVADDEARMRMVLEGRAQVADQVPLEALNRLETEPQVRVIAQPGLRVLFLCLRPDRPPFDDPRVREALDLAIDRGELVQRALAGRAQTASQVVPPAVVGHHPALRLPPTDREEARKLLAEAGHSGGLRLRLDGPSNRYQNDRKILAEVARQLAEVGVQIEVQALDKAAFFPLIEGGASSFYLLGWACESGDAGDVLGSLLHSPGSGALGAYNTLGLADAELDQLIDASDRATSGPERADRLRQAMTRVARLRVVLPLAIQTDAVLLARRVGWDPPFNLALRPEQMRPEP